MATIITHTSAPILRITIPEGRSVRGLQYGAHVSRLGWCGYYVRPAGSRAWGIARLTPAHDELPGDGSDRAIVTAVRQALAAVRGGVR